MRRPHRTSWLAALVTSSFAALVACGSSGDAGSNAGSGADSGIAVDSGSHKASTGPSSDDTDDTDAGGSSSKPPVDSGTGVKDANTSDPSDASDSGVTDSGFDASRVRDASTTSDTCSSYLTGGDCGNDLACYLGSTPTGVAGYCHAPGTAQPGQACGFSSDCAPHSVCLNPGTCFALCKYPGGACSGGKTCADFGLPGLGYCVDM